MQLPGAATAVGRVHVRVFANTLSLTIATIARVKLKISHNELKAKDVNGSYAIIELFNPI